MQPYQRSLEMLWRGDPEVEAIRKLEGWRDFHRLCGQRGFAFDRTERQGKRGPYVTVVFEVKPSRQGGSLTFKLADGQAKTPLHSVIDAYRKSGRTFLEADQCVERMLGAGDPSPAPAAGDDFDTLMSDDFEEFL